MADNAAANSGLQEALVSAQKQVSELQKQLFEAQTGRRGVDKELSRLRKQLADEQAERTTLEEQLAQNLEDTGDYTAQVIILLQTFQGRCRHMWQCYSICWPGLASQCKLSDLPASINLLLLQDTVAAYEAKYNRLKSRYRELTASHRDEVEGLHAEIGALQEKVVNLEASAAQLDAARHVEAVHMSNS